MKVGDRIRRTKIIPIRWIDEQHDSDLDGVPNYRDCQPFNPRKQDISKSEEKILMKIEKAHKLSEYHIKKIIKKHPEAKADIYAMTYDTEKPTDLDPLVKPVIREIYKKGYKTACSCQGGRGHSVRASIDVQVKARRLIVALMRAGFEPTILGVPGYIVMEYTKPLTKQQRVNLWKRALQEVQKL